MIMVSQYMPFPTASFTPPGQMVTAVGIAARSSPDNEFDKKLYDERKKQGVKNKQTTKRLPDRDTYEHASPEQEDLYAMEKAERLLW